jgi:hypothetical protein
VSDTPGPVLGSGAMLGAAVSLLALALVRAPSSPDGDAPLLLVALAVLGTAVTVAA